MKEYLFVGGANDGVRMRTEKELPYIRMVPPMRLERCYAAKPGDVVGEIHPETYVPGHWSVGAGDVVCIYALEGMSPREVLCALIAKYPEQKEAR